MTVIEYIGFYLCYIVCIGLCACFRVMSIYVEESIVDSITKAEEYKRKIKEK